jgi:hypothetical protein
VQGSDVGYYCKTKENRPLIGPVEVFVSTTLNCTFKDEVDDFVSFVMLCFVLL